MTRNHQAVLPKILWSLVSESVDGLAHFQRISDRNTQRLAHI